MIIEKYNIISLKLLFIILIILISPKHLKNYDKYIQSFIFKFSFIILIIFVYFKDIYLAFLISILFLLINHYNNKNIIDKEILKIKKKY